MKIYHRVLILSFVLIMVVSAAAGAWAAPLAAPPRQDATATPAPATSPTGSGAPVCDELQVIAIADQSGSMAGYTDEAGRYYPPTDPGGMRFEGPRYIVDTLLDLHPVGYETSRFKVAIIDFGDEPSVRMDWQDLNPLTLTEATQRKGDLAGTFNPTQPLGNTMPGPAVQAASSLFAQLDGQRPQIDSCPQRVIILFTDGLPYDDVAGFNWQTHMADLAGYARAFLPSSDYRFFVIGLDQNDAFYEQTLDAWAGATGSPDQVFLARSPAEMGAYIAQILNEALADTGTTATARGCADNGRIVVPPYMQQVRVTLFKVDPSLRLEIEDPSGRQITDGQPDVVVTGQTGVVETVTISNPAPGEWNILTQLPPGTEDQCLVNFLAIAAVEEVIDPLAGSEYSQFTRVPVTFQIVDSTGNALPDYGEDQYDLQMNVNMSYDGGEEQIMSLSANPGQQYRGEVIPYYTGTAGVVVDATAQDDNSQKFVIFPSKTIASFQVNPVSFINREGPSDGLRVGQHTELPLEYAVVNSAGDPIDLDLPVTVELKLIDQAGQETALPALAGNGGVYSGNLVLEESGLQTLAYVASVTIPPQGNQPEQLVELGSGQVAFDVFPVNLIRAEFGEVGGVATDPFLRATGLPAQVKLTDHAGTPIGPATTGAPNPMRIFEVTIRDQADGEIVLQGSDLLTTTGEPGVFQLVDNELGRGNYTIEVRPATTVAEDFIWDGTEWTAEAAGTMNPLFWAVVAAAAGVVGLVAAGSTAQVRARQHPMSGTIQIYEKRYSQSYEGEEGEMEESERPLLTQTLPRNRNKYSFNPRVGGITKIVVSSPNDQASQSKTAHLQIHRRKMKPMSAVLNPGTEINIPGTQVYIVKDRRVGGGSGSDAPDLSETF